MNLQIKKLNPVAKIPTYAHPGDAGMDLYAAETIIIPARNRGIVPTGLAFAIPDGYVGLVWDKGGVSIKGGIKTLGGVLDAGYRGELMIGVYNTTDTDYTFNSGDKVAQLLIQPVFQPTIIETEILDYTSRGEGRFGSTGK